MSAIARALYRAAMRILPADFRAHHGTEMEALYQEALARAARQSVLAWCYAAARGLADLVVYAVHAAARARSAHTPHTQRTHLTATDRMESFLLDLRLATRSLVKAPGFTFVAVLMLALGIGANTSIFSLINAVLLREPAHVERPEELVSIYTSDFSGPPFGGSSFPDYLDFRDRAPAIDDAITLEPGTVTLRGGDGVLESFVTELVTGNYFEILGVQPALGRGFAGEEGEPASGAAVAVLGHGFWLDRFGGDPDIVGQTFRASGQTLTVVGVAPEGFRGLLPLVTPDLWIPVSTQALIEGGADGFESRGNRGAMIIARLAEGSTPEIAQTQLTALARQLHQQYPDAWTDVNGEVRRVTVVDDIRVPARVRGAVNGFAALLLAVVGIVLLIVCANVANLTLARASRRRRELATKVALGAARGRIVRQLLAESAIVGLLGGVAGVATASWLIGMADRLQPLTGVAVSLELPIDRAVLLFSALVTIATVVAVGLLPALEASRPDLAPALKGRSGERSGPFRWYEPRHLLVIGQVSASLVLLVGAGLFLQSLRTAVRVDPGFSVRGVALLRVDLMELMREGYSADEARAVLDDLETRAARLPGVEATSIADAIPMTPSAGQRTVVSIPGHERAPGEDMEFQYHAVGAGFMAALGMEVLAGREFTDADDDPEAPLAMIVNETFAERFWPGESPLGKLVNFRTRREAQVVGLVRDAYYRSLTDYDRPAFFVPLAHDPSERVTLIARTSPEGEANLLPILREEIASVDTRLQITELQTMEDAIGRTLLPQRVASWLLSLAGGLGLLLATIGLYGVISFLVAQRTREIGVRMALGAEASQVVRMVVGRGLALATLGIVAGLGASAVLTRFAQSFLFGVSPLDAGVFGSMTVVAIAVAALASWVPARRASGVDPMEALRHD
jgi:predicted permease